MHGIFQELKVSFNQSLLSCLDVGNTIHENSWTNSLLQKRNGNKIKNTKTFYCITASWPLYTDAAYLCWASNFLQIIEVIQSVSHCSNSYVYSEMVKLSETMKLIFQNFFCQDKLVKNAYYFFHIPPSSFCAFNRCKN